MPIVRRVNTALIIFFILTVPEVSHARAGGGHGFGGGGGGSHGFGGGGGGGGFHFSGGGGGGSYSTGDGAADLLFVILIVVIFIVLFIGNLLKPANGAYEDAVIRRASPLERAATEAAALAAVRRADPTFDKDAFLRRVRVSFDKIQSAWSLQDLATVRPFLSDGVHERFSLQFLEQQALGYRNQVDQVTVSDLSLAQADSEGPFDTLAVRIAAQARDFDVSMADNAKRPGTDRDEPFVEIWSFVRRRGAKTDPAKPGLIEGNCPNCGAALDINQSATCQYCKALLRSGQYDWVLSEITQESVWRDDRPDTLPGVVAVRGRDPDFNVQELEDFASVCFWRKATADRTRDAKPLAKVASTQFVDAYANHFLPQPGPDGTYAYVGECAVGSVRTLGLLFDHDAQRAVLEIRWSGTRYAARAGSRPTKTGPDLLTRTLLVLTRSSSATSRADLALSSSHCPHCGAPLSLATASTCEFCGTSLNDPRHGWVLSDLQSLAAPAAQALLQQLRSTLPAGNRATPIDGTASDLLAWLAKMALADGVTTYAERQLLDQTAARYNIPASEVDRLLSALTHGQLDVHEPRDQDEARRWLDAIVAMAVADGRLQPQELGLLRRLGNQIGLSDYDLDLLIQRQHRDLFVVARDRLRDAE